MTLLAPYPRAAYRVTIPPRVLAHRAAVALALAAGLAAITAGSLDVLGKAPHAVLAGWGMELISLALLLWTGGGAVVLGRKARLGHAREERLPDLVRDLAVSRRAGLSLPAAATVAARGDYAELTPLVRRMAAQMEANVSFVAAFRMLTEEIGTPQARRLATLVEQASHAGGSVSDVLHAAARDARTHVRLRQDRVANMQVYVAIVYVAFAVFLFVAISLYASFLPKLLGAASVGGLASAGLSGAAPDLAAYRTFYFTAGLAQAVGHGAVVGVLTGGRASAGLVHSFFLVLITLVAFVGVA